MIATTSIGSVLVRKDTASFAVKIFHTSFTSVMGVRRILAASVAITGHDEGAYSMLFYE